MIASTSYMTSFLFLIESTYMSDTAYDRLLYSELSSTRSLTVSRSSIWNSTIRMVPNILDIVF